MISILVCDEDKQERAMIVQDCRKQIARGSSDDLRLEELEDDQGLSQTTESEKLVNLLYYSFQKGQPIEELRKFRHSYRSTMVMLIADSTVSPLEYLRSGIAPHSLLLRPVSENQLVQTNAEFLDDFFEQFKKNNTKDSFVIRTREEKVFIPFSQIYYFEARNKKVFVRTKNEEYAFYETIDALENSLPEGFQRCHRSYIVNTDKILKIFSADSYIELRSNLGVPLSRSYKARFKGEMQ